MANVKPRFLLERFVTTPECIKALSPIEKRICDFLVKIGDIIVMRHEEELK